MALWECVATKTGAAQTMSARKRPASPGMFVTPPPSRTRGRSRLRAASLAVAVALVLVATAAGALAVAEHNRIPAGTWVGGVDVGRKTPERAASAIEKASARRLREHVLLDLVSGTTTITGLQLGATPRIQAAVGQAADAGVFARVKARLGFGDNRRVVLLYDISRSRVTALADVLDARVATPARDGSVMIRANGTTEVVPAVNGGRVDRAALTTRLRRLPATLCRTDPDVDAAGVDSGRRASADQG